MFSLFSQRKSKNQIAQFLYDSIVHQSRQTFFYYDLGVPDTVDGRFDLILLHSFMVLNRFEREGRKADVLMQALFDCLFVDMDRSLREMGVGDLSVPKHMKRMMRAFKGRILAYEEALQKPNDLEAVLRRNLYGTVEGIDSGVLEIIIRYLQANIENLRKQPWDDLGHGRISFIVVDYEEKDRTKSYTGMVA